MPRLRARAAENGSRRRTATRVRRRAYSRSMSDFNIPASPWLIELATVQRDTGASPGSPVYDDEKQMTYLREPEGVAAIASDLPPNSKKADRETGEDQKGF